MTIPLVLLLSLAAAPRANGCATVDEEPGMSVCRVGPSEFRVLQPPDEKPESLSACRPLRYRIVPAFRNGRAYGLKLFAVHPRSFPALLGLESGDVIVNINGHPVDSPEHALETYAAVKSLSAIRVMMERAGKPRTLVYRIVRVPRRIAK